MTMTLTPEAKSACNERPINELLQLAATLLPHRVKNLSSLDTEQFKTELVELSKELIDAREQLITDLYYSEVEKPYS